jgi:uncharacterized membrane protein YhaH (DUF805 family)
VLSAVVVVAVVVGMVRSVFDSFVPFNVLVSGFWAVVALVVVVPAVVLAVRAHRRNRRGASSWALALSMVALGCAVTAMLPGVIWFIVVQHCYSSGQCL